MDEAVTTAPEQKQYPCKQCGAKLVYAPGTGAMACPYCGMQNEIAAAQVEVTELDYAGTLAALGNAAEAQDKLVVKCQTCGAETALAANVTADKCAFCGSAIVAGGASKKLIKPGCMLPFAITRQQALGSFKGWLAALWFAPSSLKRNATAEAGMKGIYLPAWTYDSKADSAYTGQRGDDYWVTESYTVTVNGKTQHRTRQVRKTRWTSVSGRVFNSFDDVLVLASASLPGKYVEALEPWDVKQAQPYADEFVAGFVCESYQIDLPSGFEKAKETMAGTIHGTICGDIGGDHQRVHSVSTRYSDIKFKHLLLPVWLSAYRYHEKTYRFMVNARTGEVQGERPWSAWKIVGAVVGGIIAAAAVAGVAALVMGAR